ncbi:MAG TPA: hypothetical protein VHE30_30170 [Polyangiaceae bacterium]|nr:hypothetical protein [Polyangiaceae bacterium]
MAHRSSAAIAVAFYLCNACGSDGASSGATAPDGGAGGSPSPGGAGGNPSTGGSSSSAGGASSGGVSTGGASGATSSGGSAGAASSGGAGALPEGDRGIAAKHPGDVGIGSDPDVIFADDFESYPTTAQGPEVNQVWDAVYQNQYVSIATASDDVHGGKQALEFTLPQETTELSDGADKVLTEEEDVLFLRYYGKFESPFDVVGSSHNGASISAHYFQGNTATPGVPADGTNKFLVNLENWRGDASTPSPGQLNVYVYHPEQRSQYGDHFYPTGLVNPNTSIPFDFGPDFVSRPDVIPELDRWYCYEYMVKANTPGQRDGRIAIWLDGKLVADFGNLRLRDVASLKIDRFGLSFHIKENPNGETHKWYDDVVAARSYIGPIAP